MTPSSEARVQLSQSLLDAVLSTLSNVSVAHELIRIRPKLILYVKYFVEQMSKFVWGYFSLVEQLKPLFVKFNSQSRLFSFSALSGAKFFCELGSLLFKQSESADEITSLLAALLGFSLSLFGHLTLCNSRLLLLRMKSINLGFVSLQS